MSTERRHEWPEADREQYGNLQARLAERNAALAEINAQLVAVHSERRRLEAEVQRLARRLRYLEELNAKAATKGAT